MVIPYLATHESKTTMANKLYSTNPLSTARGTITATGALSVNTASATGSATFLAGKMFTATGANGVVTVTMPEKFAKCEFLDVQLVDPTKTGNVASVTSDYDPTTGKFTVSILTSAQAAVTTGTFKVYFCAIFAQGM